MFKEYIYVDGEEQPPRPRTPPPPAVTLLPGVPATTARDVTMDISNVQFGWLWRKCAGSRNTL